MLTHNWLNDTSAMVWGGLYRLHWHKITLRRGVRTLPLQKTTNVLTALRHTSLPPFPIRYKDGSRCERLRAITAIMAEAAKQPKKRKVLSEETKKRKREATRRDWTVYSCKLCRVDIQAMRHLPAGICTCVYCEIIQHNVLFICFKALNSSARHQSYQS